jgi:hypothetical protein
MAQPTRSDDQAVRRRLSHNNLRRKQWRRRLPRAERKRPRRSGNSAALNLRGARRAPHFFIPISYTSCCSLLRPAGRAHEARSLMPGRRARRQSAPAKSLTPQSTSEGRNPQWRRRLKAERRRRRRRDSSLLAEKGTRFRVPFFISASSHPRSARDAPRPTAASDPRPRFR